MTPAALWTKHRPLAYGLARHYRLPGMSHDDVVQEALIGLWVAARQWHPGDAPFGAYANLIIRRRLITAVKLANRGKHQLLNRSVRELLDDDGNTSAASDLIPAPDTDPADIIDRRNRLQRVVDAMQHLTDLEHDSLHALIDGETYEHAAGRLGVTTKAVDNAAQRARRKVRAAAA